MSDPLEFLIGMIAFWAPGWAANREGLRIRPGLVLASWACTLGSAVLILAACFLFLRSPVLSLAVGMGAVPLTVYGILLAARSCERPPAPPPDHWSPPDSTEVARVIRGADPTGVNPGGGR